MTPEQVLKEFEKAGALLKGHFVLSSGLHSDTFLQKALVFQDAKRTAKLAKAQELGVAPVRHELLARLQKANKTALKRCVADYATVWRRRAQQPLPLQVG